MIACICMEVSSSEIDQAIKDGAKNIGEVQAKTGIGGGCSICMRALERYFYEQKEKASQEKDTSSNNS